MCKQGLLVDLGDFNMIEFYQKHQQSQVRNVATLLHGLKYVGGAGREHVPFFPDLRNVEGLCWQESDNIHLAYFSEKTCH